eukprot:CAMPEP_0204352342 /NCGR_PEP_ID=MMETSP0469-20131031/31805_1 /ASSEMBLY_ACC=CAM_ASM_000384 /TAXON_ID=2969 /ORGANISM="Oxyrrhis marina" /LENGTH=287 /DNA_ID=CAMNT_0051339059 /DNA_START=46 /DNA_END=909 /DNA_ORIENTATION=+
MYHEHCFDVCRNLEVADLTDEEARVLMQLARQVARERHGDSQPRLSALRALTQLPDAALAQIISSVNASTPGKNKGLQRSVDTCPGGNTRPRGDHGACTTIMVKCLGKFATVHTIREALDLAGFAGCYDFVYVPVSIMGDPPRHHNRFGFGIVNFVTCGAAQSFMDGMKGRSLCRGGKELQLCRARIQGLESNVQQFLTRWRDGKLEAGLDEVMVPWVFTGMDSSGMTCGSPMCLLCAAGHACEQETCSGHLSPQVMSAVCSAHSDFTPSSVRSEPSCGEQDVPVWQ